jgi:hypothetical protein
MDDGAQRQPIVGAIVRASRRADERHALDDCAS